MMTTKTTAATAKVQHFADALPPPLSDVLRLDGSITEMMTRPFEALLRWQGDLLKAVEPAAMGWLERRRDGTAAALDALQKLARCTDLADAAAIQRDWLDGALKRMSAEVTALTEQTMALSQEAAAVVRSAAQPPAAAPAPRRRAAERETQSEAAA
jgi:hypothetical protein